MTSSPSQHKRTEDAITRSEIWFRDGSVVLQAQNTQFRVHFGLLARHSSVFSDMWELPQPSDEPTIEGCPVMQLSDDPIDVGYLLKALYDSAFHSQRVMPLPVLGAMIRLGRKYDFKDLLHSAVERVTAEYPRTLEKYIAMPDSFQTIERYKGIDFDMVTLLSENKLFAALPLACYLAVETTTLVNTKLLPRLYTCLMACQSELLEGILKDDGTRASLSEGDRNRCVMGRQTLLVKQFEPGYTFGWLRKWDFTDCPSPTTCRSRRETELGGFMRDYRIWAANRIFLTWDNWKLCAACSRHAPGSVTAGGKKIWQELPEIFGLPPWDQLENDL
ncbi:BTB domain-containing protein [Mycena sanguinolenta]|uniref:BTB domain-containing protein n=1 Tax=Mycena sanguinolenta TaxID=230812 RepID=A0A8H7DCH1_9AGAR|nr:BTB domain-containing protein [Mycena sanguinolenta]